MSKKKMLNNEAGFMGLEGMGALLFYLIMIAGAALLIVQLFSGGKLSDMEKGLSALRMNVQQLYTTQGTYADLDTATVIQAGIVPSGFKHDDATITSPWNTDIKVDVADPNTAFTITVEDVPADDCVKLAMYDLEAWDSVAISEGAAATTPSVVTSVETATAACPAGKAATFVFTAH